MGVAMFTRCARYYEHAHRVSKLRPGINIATEHAEKVRPEYLEVSIKR